MKYDPVKRSLGKVFNTTPFARKIFYRLLDILLLRTWYIKREVKKIKDQLDKEANILDAGAGFGQYSYFLSRISKTWNILAVDVKEQQVEDCNHFFSKIGKSDRVHFEVADLTKFNSNDKFDAALSVDVMEHIEDDVSVFKNIQSSLKQGGILLISTPSDKGGSDVHHHHEESFIDEHVRDGYSIADIEEKLRIAGFSSIESKYSYGKPGVLSWKISMKYPVVMLNKSKLFFILLHIYYVLTLPFCLLLNYLDVNNFHQTGTGLIVKAIK